MVTLKINLAAIRHNLKIIKDRASVPIYAVVKADAYGHGAELSKFLEPHVHAFAVSCLKEAEEIRGLKIKKPILVLCPSDELISHEDIIYTVTDKESLPKKKGTKVALKINTGMNRLGVRTQNALELADEIIKNGLVLQEVFTHFTSLINAKNQFADFKKVADSLGVTAHCCGSNCLFLPPKMHCDRVRCGLAMYGYGHPNLFPVLSAYTVVGQINFVKKGERIGYGDHLAKSDLKVAVLQAGYADGIRRLSGRRVRINGYTCPIVGNICMDMCMADISDAYVEKGDRAYFLDNILNAEALAAEQNTISYEILTLFSAKRIQRIYE